MTINTLREFIMETMNRARYEAPSTEVLEVTFEGIICQSPGIQSMRSGYGTAQEDEWE